MGISTRSTSYFDRLNDQVDHHQDGESEQEMIFNMIVRVNFIYVIILIFLYMVAHAIISIFNKRLDELPTSGTSSKRVAKCLDEDEDVLVYRISTWLCAFTLAISIGAASLLPFSILANELLGDSTTTATAIINTNALSTSSHLSSSSTTQQNLLSSHHTSSITWLNGLWSYVFLFSNLSLFLILPFTYFFTESQGFPGRRGIWARVRETLVVFLLVSALVLGLTYIVCLLVGIGMPIFSIWQYLPFLYSCISFIGVLLLLLCTPRGILHLVTVFNQLDTIQKSRNLHYFMAMGTLLLLTGSSMLLVLLNTFKLLGGFKALPKNAMSTTIGYQIRSLSKMGPVGATIEIVLILYLWCASLVGLYNLPGFCSLRPEKGKTSIYQIIGNCAILCLLSSALPLLSRTLGITNFDLLADFGSVEWLGNFYVVLLYNLVFLVTIALCLANRLSKPLLLGLQQQSSSRIHPSPTSNNSKKNK